MDEWMSLAHRLYGVADPILRYPAMLEAIYWYFTKCGTIQTEPPTLVLQDILSIEVDKNVSS